jgi:hypothetical protein
MILFVSIIQLRPRPTEHLSYLLDAFFCYREELLAAHVKSHEYADCERDCNEVPTGRICKFGWYRHYCFDDTDGYLLCGAIIDALRCLLGGYDCSDVCGGKSPIP